MFANGENQNRNRKNSCWALYHTFRINVDADGDNHVFLDDFEVLGVRSVDVEYNYQTPGLAEVRIYLLAKIAKG